MKYRTIAATIALLLIISFALYAASDAEYKISVSDLLEISVYDEPDLTKTVRVSHEGAITYPLLGPVSVVGLSASELEAKLTELLAADYLVNPQVSVFVKEHAKISVVGQVKKPGSYELRTGLTVLEAVALAGDVTDLGDPTNVTLVRKLDGREIEKPIDLTAMRTGEVSGPGLEPNDIIRVKELGLVSVVGQVKKPGRYPIRQGTMVIDAIALAGGVTDIASPGGTKVIRKRGGKEVVITVPVDAILKCGSQSKDVLVEGDDTIMVPESFF